MANENDTTTSIARWADELRHIRQKSIELTAAIEQLPWASPADRDSAPANYHLPLRMAEIVLALNEAKRLTDKFWQ
jgi:hypothetical protein